MFLLPVRGEEIARKRRIVRTKSKKNSKFSLFLSLFFFLPRLMSSEIDRYRSIATGNGRNRPLSPDNG
ncbi:hypothetical protein B296_00023435 [Ensete ventricosum]|uniref:Uncharacterized protein n=1 Tax=Ensete ventricosum TaxID=4639 RepID=A0A426Y5G9_ENSVE|nr:hypothetical protein B296_00023435 [Ensete ventricosum]